MNSVQDQGEIVHAILQSRELQAVINEGRKLFPHPLILTDAAYQVLAISEEPELEHQPWVEISTQGAIPLTHTNTPETTRTQRESLRTGHSVIEPSHNGAPAMLRMMLCSEKKKVIGHLDAPCYGAEGFSQQDIDWFELIADVCTLRMEKQYHYTRSPRDILDFFLADLLEGRLTNEALIEQRLKFFHWDLKLPLQIVTLRFRQGADQASILVLQDHCDRMLSEYPQFSGFVYGDCVKLIVPATAAAAIGSANQRQFAALLKELKLIAGISRPFRRYPEFAEFNQQSEKAIELGLLLNHSYPIHFYDELALFTALEYAADHIDLMRLCHSAVYRLADYDRDHNTVLLETLEVFLRSHMNVPEAANRLCVHRNTMTYRINKIHELVDIDLDNSETVFHLLLSFHILEYYSATVMKDQDEQRKRKPRMY